MERERSLTWRAPNRRLFAFAVMKSHFMFNRMTDTQLNKIASHSERFDLRGGEDLCRQGDTNASFLYVVYEGGCDVFVQKEPDCPPIEIGHFGPGACLGEQVRRAALRRLGVVIFLLCFRAW